MNDTSGSADWFRLAGKLGEKQISVGRSEDCCSDSRTRRERDFNLIAHRKSAEMRGLPAAARINKNQRELKVREILNCLHGTSERHGRRRNYGTTPTQRSVTLLSIGRLLINLALHLMFCSFRP